MHTPPWLRLQSLLAAVLRPRMSVSIAAIIVRHGRVLLLLHGTDEQPSVSLPVASLGNREQPAEALRRVVTTVGYDLETCQVAHVDRSGPGLMLYYHCVASRHITSHNVSSLTTRRTQRWCALDTLPSSLSSTQRRALVLASLLSAHDDDESNAHSDDDTGE